MWSSNIKHKRLKLSVVKYIIYNAILRELCVAPSADHRGRHVGQGRNNISKSTINNLFY